MPTTSVASPNAAASILVAALEGCWAAIRTRHPQVPEAVIILGQGSDARRGLLKLGHFAAARWHVQGASRPEVLVGGEGLRRGATDVLATLLHEAAHGLAHSRGIRDTSRQGRWHNRHYAALAAELGLTVAQGPKHGWSATTVPDQLAAAYADQLAALDAALTLWRHAEQHAGRAQASRNLLACSCPCGRKLRVSRSTLAEAPIVCGACAEPFEPDDPGQGQRQGQGG